MSNGSIGMVCFNTQPPEGGWSFARDTPTLYTCFNTQPPEGGWEGCLPVCGLRWSFNTQPPEGGWVQFDNDAAYYRFVSTHSRLKAAGTG